MSSRSVQKERLSASHNARQSATLVRRNLALNTFRRYAPALILFFVAMIPWSMHAQSGRSSTGSFNDDRLLQQAEDAMNASDFAKAEAILQTLHFRHPHNFAIDETSALFYAEQGKFAQAIPLMQTAVREQPGSDIAHANLGAAYLKLGRPQDAAHELEAAVKLNPSNASAQEALGQVWMLLKEPRKAVAAFTVALRTDDSNPDLLYNAALALYDCGEAARSEELLAHIPENDSSAEAQSLYGDVEEDLKHYQQAVQHYMNAVRLAPTEANTYMLAAEFLRHWTFDTAVKEFAAGTQQYPNSIRMRVGLGIAYYANSNYPKATSIFSDLLKENPSNVLYAELLGRNCVVLTEGFDPRCMALIEYAKQHPHDAWPNVYAATMLLHRPGDNAQLELTEQLLQNAVKANPNLPQAMYGMGFLLQRELKWKQSIPMLESAVRIKPDYAAAHYRLAIAYAHIGEHEKAQSEVVLEQKSRHQQIDDLDNRLQQVTTFVIDNEKK